MKIKRKVEKNLPQLIEWATENEIRNEDFYSDVFNGFDKVKVSFNLYGDFYTDDHINKKVLFNVEDEVEITEDTKLDYMYLIASNTDYSEGYYNYSINDVLSNNEGYYKELAILIIDPEPAIIWTRDKGLV